MDLNNVVVAAQHELDDSICVKADYRGERVFAEIPRIALDDYFPNRTLTHAQRRSLVESNKETKPSPRQCCASANSRHGGL